MTTKPTKTELRAKYVEFLERERALIAPRLTGPEVLKAYNAAIDTLKRTSLFPPPSKAVAWLLDRLDVQFTDMPQNSDRDLAIESLLICIFR